MMKTFIIALNHPTLQEMNTNKENDCITMGDWLWVCNAADVVPFIEAFRMMAEH